ncbi:hemolysin-III related-domain-containing protein [Flagelloscypha sp. PMI_526]|nr:hemolysin-III related-domain-containing protein [Flagelloscypha sp. PMI_526]
MTSSIPATTSPLPTSHSDSSLVTRQRSNSRRHVPRTSSSSSLCYPMPHTQSLDLTSTSPTETLASIRLLVLSYLADLETRISETDAPWKGKGEMTVEELRQWSNTALEMLEDIRDDVRSHLPDFPSIGEVESSVERFVKAHLPDMHDFDFSSRFPDLPQLPDFRAKLDEFCDAFQNIDIPGPLSFVPQLSEHFEDLQKHFADIELPTSTWSGPSALLSDMVDSLMNSDLVQEILNASETEDAGESDGDMLEAAAAQAVHIAHAVKRSFRGSKLIQLSDVPHPWRSNPFVKQGYRFIPLDKWPLIILSIFALHNETLNIHTHLIPFLGWSFESIPFLNPSLPETPELLYTLFALVCLGTSATWHVMAGCASVSSMEFCARLDYVGIGWLISASVGTVVYYGFSCQPALGNSFLVLCFTTGIMGTVFPFMKWFNDYEYRKERVAFFLSLAFTALGPMTVMSYYHGVSEMFAFISPIATSLLCYVIGLVFYVTHIPECWMSEKWVKRFDVIGGGSHCVWHLFIVAAVALHKAAIPQLKMGYGEICSA